MSRSIEEQTTETDSPQIGCKGTLRINKRESDPFLGVRLSAPNQSENSLIVQHRTAQTDLLILQDVRFRQNIT